MRKSAGITSAKSQMGGVVQVCWNKKKKHLQTCLVFTLCTGAAIPAQLALKKGIERDFEPFCG